MSKCVEILLSSEVARFLQALLHVWLCYTLLTSDSTSKLLCNFLRANVLCFVKWASHQSLRATDFSNTLPLTWGLQATCFKRMWLEWGTHIASRWEGTGVGDNILGAFISCLVASGPVRSDLTQAGPQGELRVKPFCERQCIGRGPPWRGQCLGRTLQWGPWTLMVFDCASVKPGTLRSHHLYKEAIHSQLWSRNLSLILVKR